MIQLKEMVASSDNIVFFGGAGVSTESGIPDFRSVDAVSYTHLDVYKRQVHHAGGIVGGVDQNCLCMGR